MGFAKRHMSAVFLSKPSLIDVRVSAFVAVAVIVRRAAGRAFGIGMVMVGASPYWSASFWSCVVVGRSVHACAAGNDDDYEKYCGDNCSWHG